MSRRWPVERREDSDRPASGTVSRLLVLGFLSAGVLGLLAGAIWIGWNLMQ